MERMLQKLAATLNSYDEASLMNLWQKYAMQVHTFEPSKRWEEAALALCMIQAVQWKNKLFNYNLMLQAENTADVPPPPEPTLPPANLFMQGKEYQGKGHEGRKPAKKQAPTKATVLSFPKKD